jgi:hypothetical protein
MQTDVKSVTVTADGTAVAYRTRVKSLAITSTATAGSVVLKDGGASGTALLTLNTPAAADFHNILIPGQGVLFERDVYVDVTDVSSVTVFYG